MKYFKILFFLFFMFLMNIYAVDTMEGLSFGINSGFLLSPNADKFNLFALDGRNKKFNTSTFITLGGAAKFGLNDKVGFEVGFKKPIAANIDLYIYNYEMLYVFNPYEKNRYYGKIGGLYGKIKSDEFENYGKFDVANGLTYTLGAEFGYSDFLFNLSLSYFNLDFNYSKNRTIFGSNKFDLSGFLILCSYYYYFK